MAHWLDMDIDFEKVIDDAGKPEADRKSHPFHLSSAVVSEFKEACEKVNRSNAKILEVLMSRFSEHVNQKGTSKKKK